jgi:hypothetical protein
MATLYCPSNAEPPPPSIYVTSNNTLGGDRSQQLPPLTTAELRRQRKISRSSENLSSDSHPIDSMLTPFALLSQGLQSLGSNLVDSNSKLLSRSCEHFMGLELGQEPPEMRNNSQVNSLLDGRLMRGGASSSSIPACQSLVLNI